MKGQELPTSTIILIILTVVILIFVIVYIILPIIKVGTPTISYDIQKSR